MCMKENEECSYELPGEIEGNCCKGFKCTPLDVLYGNEYPLDYNHGIGRCTKGLNLSYPLNTYCYYIRNLLIYIATDMITYFFILVYGKNDGWK